MTRFVLELVRPYRSWLVIVFVAMLAEIATSLAAPWPLKLVLDDALVNQKLPHWLSWAHNYRHRAPRDRCRAVRGSGNPVHRHRRRGGKLR